MLGLLAGAKDISWLIFPSMSRMCSPPWNIMSFYIYLVAGLLSGHNPCFWNFYVQRQWACWPSPWVVIFYLVGHNLWSGPLGHWLKSSRLCSFRIFLYPLFYFWVRASWLSPQSQLGFSNVADLGLNVYNTFPRCSGEVTSFSHMLKTLSKWFMILIAKVHFNSHR